MWKVQCDGASGFLLDCRNMSKMTKNQGNVTKSEGKTIDFGANDILYKRDKYHEKGWKGKAKDG